MPTPWYYTDFFGTKWVSWVTAQYVGAVTHDTVKGTRVPGTQKCKGFAVKREQPQLTQNDERRRAGRARAIAALQTCKLHRWVPLGKNSQVVAFGRHRHGGCVALLPAVCLLRSGNVCAASSGLACGRLQGVGLSFLGLPGTPFDEPARYVPPGPVCARLRAAALPRAPAPEFCAFDVGRVSEPMLPPERVPPGPAHRI